jgi:hypothetical protein
VKEEEYLCLWFRDAFLSEIGFDILDGRWHSPIENGLINHLLGVDGLWGMVLPFPPPSRVLPWLGIYRIGWLDLQEAYREVEAKLRELVY